LTYATTTIRQVAPKHAERVSQQGSEATPQRRDTILFISAPKEQY